MLATESLSNLPVIGGSPAAESRRIVSMLDLAQQWSTLNVPASKQAFEVEYRPPSICG